MRKTKKKTLSAAWLRKLGQSPLAFDSNIGLPMCDSCCILGSKLSSQVNHHHGENETEEDDEAEKEDETGEVEEEEEAEEEEEVAMEEEFPRMLNDLKHENHCPALIIKALRYMHTAESSKASLSKKFVGILYLAAMASRCCGDSVFLSRFRWVVAGLWANMAEKAPIGTGRIIKSTFGGHEVSFSF